jgi:tight adherence protein C
MQAGLQGEMPADLYQSARILGPVVFLIIGSMLPLGRVFWIAALPAIAYLVPDLVLSHLVRRRRDRIRRSVPDVVDLLVICVDAGLGLDQAMLRVGEELSVSHPEANAEILHINREQRAGRPRSEAWAAMAERVKLPDIDALVNMLMQTERFGTPIARALSIFAEGVRLKRRQAAEEMAARSTIKIIFPLVFFIFPAIFIVLLGPAVLNIMHAMSHQK